jgi:hypothetical protein
MLGKDGRALMQSPIFWLLVAAISLLIASQIINR